MKRSRQSQLVLAILATCSCAGATRSPEQEPNLTVLVHDYAGLSAPSLDVIEQEVRVAFAHAGVELQWAVCRGEHSGAAPECDANLAPGRFTLRILARYPKDWPKGADPLGSADIASSYASVYAEEIRANAAAKNVGFELLVAYAAAHEIGHLLLGSRHSSSGIMQASWGNLTCRNMSQRWLDFNTQERDVIRHVLAQRPVTARSVVPQH